MTTIDPAIIEKAARAKFQRTFPESWPGANDNDWANVSEEDKQVYRDAVVRTLTSVYADIQAAALREAATAQRGSLWLRARADELDGGTS